MMAPSIPRATYRWQFHAGFTFKQATGLVAYLNQLGISHVYTSPFFRANPGTTHGYDVSNPNEFNAEIGSRADFDALVAELHRHDMGMVVDFVPNHMGVGDPTNYWWMDVLEHGQASPYARFFDIEWDPLKPGMKGKVLYPILPDQYGRLLEAGHFKIEFHEGVFRLRCETLQLPLDHGTIVPVLQAAADHLNPSPDEIVSIITALRNLPARTEQDEERIAERLRETRVSQNRLAVLCAENPNVRQAIDQALAEWQDTKNPQSMDKMDALLTAQAYRLSSWRVAAEEINYRRFFDVNSLAGVRVELPEVFKHTHQLILELVGKGQIQGIRIDHIDGLAKPMAYLETLQKEIASQLGDEDSARDFYLIVEKILSGDERLRSNWPTHGTTGYDFAGEVTRVLIDPRSESAMQEAYQDFAQAGASYREVVYEAKKLVMQTSLASEVNMLGIMLSKLAQSHRWYRDFTLNALTTAVREVIACFPVYRTYIVPEATPDEEDVQVVNRAVAQARRRNPALERSMFEFVARVLVPPANDDRPLDEETRRLFLLKFQQCTGPVTAKGVEDTSFYVYNRFVALNEVGCSPALFGMSVDAFHRQCSARTDFPNSMLGSSTHDTKRSEDVRARLAVISELPQQWRRMVNRWKAANQEFKRKIHGEWAPDNNEEYLIYQTIVGSWPLTKMSLEERQDYLARIQQYMKKALREAKVNSSWIEPSETWHEATDAFIAAILNPEADDPLPDFVRKFIQKISALGAVNSLGQTVLKLTVPGVPDTYQGTEIWDFSLVDPDNRRPVDYQRRMTMLNRLDDPPAQLFSRWRDGRIKLFIVRQLLELRRQMPRLFQEGIYEPVKVEGTFAENCIVFERKHEDRLLLVVVSRLASQVGSPPIEKVWTDTWAAPNARPRVWRDVFTGDRHEGGSGLPLALLLKTLPVAVLVGE